MGLMRAPYQVGQREASPPRHVLPLSTEHGTCMTSRVRSLRVASAHLYTPIWRRARLPCGDEGSALDRCRPKAHA